MHSLRIHKVFRRRLIKEPRIRFPLLLVQPMMSSFIYWNFMFINLRGFFSWILPIWRNSFLSIRLRPLRLFRVQVLLRRLPDDVVLITMNDLSRRSCLHSSPIIKSNHLSGLAHNISIPLISIQGLYEIFWRSALFQIHSSCGLYWYLNSRFINHCGRFLFSINQSSYSAHRSCPYCFRTSWSFIINLNVNCWSLFG